MNKKALQFDICWLSLGLGFIFLLFGHDHALLNPDETRYSEIAREMLATGDFITPRLNGVIFFDKPILYYWLQAFSMFCFGVNEWALRFFPALFGILGCLCVYIGGHALFDRKTGLYSALLLASTPLYFFAAHYANMDLEVAVLITACLLSFIIAMQARFIKHRAALLYLAYSFAGLAILTKGLIGIAFPTMIIGAWILITNQWSLIKSMRLPTGFLLIGLIVLPWFYLVQAANPNFYHYFFTIQHIQRFLSSDFNGQSPVWFYLPVIVLGTFPWILLLIPGCYHASKTIKQSSSLLYLILWASLIFIFFSIPTSKLIGYILPIVPPLILLAARYLVLHIESAYKWMINSLLGAYGILTGIVFYLPRSSFFTDGSVMLKPSLLLGSTLLIGTLCIGFFHFFKNKIITWNVTIAMTAANILMLSLLIPILPIPSNKSLINHVQKIIQPGDEIVNYLSYLYDVPLYTQQTVTLVSNWGDPSMMRKDNWQRIFSYGLNYSPKNRQHYIKPDALWKRWHEPKRLFVFTRKSHLPHFTEQVSPIFIVAKEKSYLVISNQM